jgi:threonine synthase
MRRTGGGCAAVPDAEIVDAIALLARTEGIFTETAGGVTIGALRRLAAQGVIRSDERVVAYVTGNGYKTQESLKGVLPRPVVIPASLGAFDQALAAVA